MTSRISRPIPRSTAVLLSVAGLVALVGCEPNPNRPGAATAPQQVSRATVQVPSNVKPGPINRTSFAKLLAATDEAILAQGLEVRIAEQSSLAAAGSFEPVAYAELNRTGENSQTSAADFLAQGGETDEDGNPAPFEEYETAGRVGVEFLDRRGISVDLFYEMSQVRNSLQSTANRPTPEYFGAAGLEVRAPLLRNSGKVVNTSNEVVAVIDGEIAGETVRLISAQRLFDGLTAYTLVQRARAQLHWRQQIADLAADLETEMQRQVGQGLRSQTDLIEATSQRAQRVSEVTLARQDLTERLGAFQIYFSGLQGGTAAEWSPSESLAPVSSRYQSRSAYGSVDKAFGQRPEARINALRLEREEVLRMVAERQIRPQADLVLDFRQTQLDGDYIPFRDVYSLNNPYESWRIGFEFRRGLQGDRALKSELETAKLREKQAELAMNAFRQRIASEINGIASILARARERLAQQDRVIAAQRSLLEAEQTALSNGSASELDVIARRINLAIAQEQRADAIAQLNLATYLASQIDGTLLSRFGVGT